MWYGLLVASKADTCLSFRPFSGMECIWLLCRQDATALRDSMCTCRSELYAEIPHAQDVSICVPSIEPRSNGSLWDILKQGIFADRTSFHWISLHSSCWCRDWEHSGYARCQLGSISPLWRLQSPEKKRTQKAQDSPRNFLRHSRPASLHFFFAVGYECALNSFPSQRSWWLQVKDFSLRQWKDSRKSICRRSYRKGSCKSHPFPLKIKIPIKGLQKKLGNDAAFIRMSHVNPCERFQCKANLS